MPVYSFELTTALKLRFYAPEIELKIRAAKQNRAAKLHFYCTIDSKNRGQSFVFAESTIIAGPSPS